jgi:hypothetical protein
MRRKRRRRRRRRRDHHCPREEGFSNDEGWQ